MRIKHLEIANFRKLLSVRIDVAAETTLFVGANNSGKTSAIVALRRFLMSEEKFTFQDISVSHIPRINTIGNQWVTDRSIPSEPSDWNEVLPMLDVWLDVNEEELHLINHLIPTLDWTAGTLGVRLRFEPRNVEELKREFLERHDDALSSKAALQDGVGANDSGVKLWPENLAAFLDRRLRSHFTVRTYSLDPLKLTQPVNEQAKLQALPMEFDPIDGNALVEIICVDDIDAQRGLSNSEMVESAAKGFSERSKLTAQLRRYYRNHLDTLERPGAADLEALRAIEGAQQAFDGKLSASFASALAEVSGLGYPGVTDPKIKFSTKVRPVDGLDHEAAVQYEVDMVPSTDGVVAPNLPEHYNGLGFQNLIWMIFKLMDFREGWMRGGKRNNSSSSLKPLHIVLVEEPEAHLHAQVQQVFIKKAYKVLRQHEKLGDNKALNTQLFVSTHSSYVAYEMPFSALRYFRRLPAGISNRIPTSAVVNLNEVFGSETETNSFVTRYLRTQHCDLFFADAIILVEGPAEKILIPHFIRNNYPILNQSYVTLLEIGGSHAHRLRSLVELLGIHTLVITDLDSVANNDGTAVLPKTGAAQKTANSTLRSWIPAKETTDELLNASFESKEKANGPCCLRVAYQCPVEVTIKGHSVLVCASTFEDALAFENIEFVKQLSGAGLTAKFRKATTEFSSANELAEKLFGALKNGKKAELALDILNSEDFESVVVPTYIREALGWLQQRVEGVPPNVNPSMNSAETV